MYLLGISAYYHDSAAALVKDGVIVAAVQEERFSRKKHDEAYPHASINYCLQQAGISADQVDYVVFYEKPFLKFERLLETYLSFAPRGLRSFLKAMPVWLKQKLFIKQTILQEMKKLAPSISWKDRILFAEHHQSHAASAFYPSPFDKAIVLTMDGVGEWATTSVALGSGQDLKILKEIHFPHSLGLLYSSFTYYTGFKVNSGEYKVMGLAPYGQPRYSDLIRKHLIDVKEDGSFRLNMDYFSYCTGLVMVNRRFEELFGAPARKPESMLTQRDMDLAASIQEVTEEVVLRMARHLRKEYGIPNLCLSGGVALNCVANGKILQEKIFDKIWVQPASGDAGGALGAALAAYHDHFHQPRIVSPATHDSMQGSYLGPSYSQKEIETALTAEHAVYRLFNEEDMLATIAEALAQDKVVGWFQGRMEFGPRALGARSILGNPASAKMQSVLNLKIKYRESFRPFAPAILAENVSDWFQLEGSSPYMMMVAPVSEGKRLPSAEKDKDLPFLERLNLPRSLAPAITHIDYSARVQTVHPETHPLFHKLIGLFREKTGIPLLINTSFNVRGEPIVCSPADAFRCFMGTDMDVLVVGECVLKKEDQPANSIQDYKDRYELD